MHRFNGLAAPEHPLFSVNRCTGTCSLGEREFTTDFYMVGFKKLQSGIVRYGRTKYDHDTGSMSFIKPRQVIAFNDLEFEEDGFMIFLHEDFFNGHHLHADLDKYSFFDYQNNEALHLSPREEKLIWSLFFQIQSEYESNMDEFSKDIILTHIETLLKYAQRFYKRQFVSRAEPSGYTVTKFYAALESYIESGELDREGLPPVSRIAADLNLSPRYLSDLLKRETGKTTIELLHIYLIGEAKNRLVGAMGNISAVAYSLGFENLSYFSRLFKRETGLSPLNYKKQMQFVVPGN